MMGPTLLFDKSFLQALSLDEAVMLDQLFRCVISPLFFVETMADLAKRPTGKRDPLQTIKALADRTPVAHSYMNTHHQSLILGELLGHRVQMNRQPVMAGGIPVRTQGREGVVFELSPEAEAFQRWQSGKFSDVEHITARLWRASLDALDLPGIAAGFKAMLRKEERPRSHSAARSTALAVINSTGQNFRLLTLACEFLDIPADRRQAINKAWKRSGSPPLPQYAPYAAHCLAVDLYFYLAISNGIISDQRASNRRDIEYLYYLPFASIFVSGDKLHRAAAEQFLGLDQSFVWGPDLKRDLASINSTFLRLPKEERAQGLFTLVDRPPIGHQGPCADLWDKLHYDWRTAKPPRRSIAPKAHKELIRRSTVMREAARAATRATRPNPPPDQLDHLMIKRLIPTERGSWRMFGPDIDSAPREGIIKSADIVDEGPSPE